MALLMVQNAKKHDQKSNCLHKLALPKNANIHQDEEVKGAAEEDIGETQIKTDGDGKPHDGFNYGEYGKYLNTRLRASARREKELLAKFQEIRQRLVGKLNHAIRKQNAKKERKYQRKLWFMNGLTGQRLDFNALHDVYELY